MNSYKLYAIQIFGQNQALDSDFIYLAHHVHFTDSLIRRRDEEKLWKTH